jgi:glycosyltransferase involved in cell wall biosynthesis
LNLSIDSPVRPKIVRPKIGFLFGQGHGHYAQFLNFQECCPPEEMDRIEWVPLSTDSSEDFWANLSRMPAGMRYRRHQLWHVQNAIAQQPEWDALFFAAMQLRFLPFLQRHRSYLYTDFAPSGKRELSPWYDHMDRSPLPLKILKHRLETRLHQACRGIFTMSRWASDGLVQDYGLDPARMHVVLPGANLHHWPYVDRSGRTAGPTRILFVGGEFVRKGGPQLLDWAEKTSVHGWEIDIVAWPDYLPDWVRDCLSQAGPDDGQGLSLAPRLPHVRVHCHLKANTPELMRLFEQADIFCLPTQADGSSIAGLEAMASGLPVLLGAVGGIPELIDDGKTGFLLPRGETQTLADRLEMLIADAPLRAQVGRAARQSCESFFNVTRQVKDILTIMDQDRSPT